MAQGHQLMVHLRADTMAAEESVDGEGEVEGRAVGWQRADLSLRREHEYLAGKEVQFDGVEEVHRIRLGVVEDFLDGAQPVVEFVLVLRVFLFHAVLVFPMGGKSLFCHLIHTV